MKLIYKSILLMLPLLSVVSTSCSEETLIETVSAIDAPQILDPLFPDRVKGELPIVSNINRDQQFKMSLVVTPSASTNVTWYIDGEKYTEGTKIDTILLAGKYHMKVVATNAGQETYREGYVMVNPLPTDPISEPRAFERIIAPGAPAMLYGTNLDKVKTLKFGDNVITKFTYNAEDGSIAYSVPQSAQNGVFRLVFEDPEGVAYGANTVTVSAGAMVISGADRLTTGEEAVLTGINLNTVSSIKIGDTQATIVTKSNTSLTIKCPTMADGDYMMTGSTANGAVEFIAGNAIATQIKVAVSSQKTLWSGHHYVSWDKADGDPNKTFNAISAAVFASMKPGSTITIHYSVNSSDAYHKMGVATGWWGDLIPQFEFNDDGAIEVEMTKERLDRIASEAGFLIIGHGFYVDRVTLK